MYNVTKKVGILTYKGKEILAVNVYEFDPQKALEKKLECDANFSEFIYGFETRIRDLENQVAKLTDEIKYLKGEK